jgi:hypothetical protein
MEIVEGMAGDVVALTPPCEEAGDEVLHHEEFCKREIARPVAGPKYPVTSPQDRAREFALKVSEVCSLPRSSQHQWSLFEARVRQGNMEEGRSGCSTRLTIAEAQQFVAVRQKPAREATATALANPRACLQKLLMARLEVALPRVMR